jgi:hypothetical protein
VRSASCIGLSFNASTFRLQPNAEQGSMPLFVRGDDFCTSTRRATAILIFGLFVRYQCRGSRHSYRLLKFEAPYASIEIHPAA